MRLTFLSVTVIAGGSHPTGVGLDELAQEYIEVSDLISASSCYVVRRKTDLSSL